MGVYCDHNATTPVDPRVAAAMRGWLEERHGNPSSAHAWGRAAREAVETARDEVAALLGGEPLDVLFTASGTESNNTVLLSCGLSSGWRGHVVVSALEHPSVLEAARFLEERGMEVSRIDPGPSGVVDASEMAAALRADTRLVCLMLANNEIGTLQPVEQVAAACRRAGVPLLCDAVQAAGKVPVSVRALGADLVTIGAHKFHGPLGAAALWVRRGVEVSPLLHGGGQERSRRAGTINVPAVVGFGVAARLARLELAERMRHLAALRRRFEEGLGGVPDIVIHGAAAPRLPNTSHVACLGVAGQALAIRLDLRGWAVSTGSACASGAVAAGPAMRAMGMSDAEALASVRISFGMPNTRDHVDGLLSVLAEEVGALRRQVEAPR